MSEGKTNRIASLTAKSLKNLSGGGRGEKRCQAGEGPAQWATCGDALTLGWDKDKDRRPGSPGEDSPRKGSSQVLRPKSPFTAEARFVWLSHLCTQHQNPPGWLFTAWWLSQKGFRRTVLGKKSGALSCLTVPLLTGPQQQQKAEDLALPGSWQPAPQAAKTLLPETL